MRNNPKQARALHASKTTTNVCYLPADKNKRARIEDLLLMAAPEYDNSYKNPCFYETCKTNETRTKFRCLPYFHLLGVDKCGSTDLFLRLLEHPHILGNDGSLNKETMWWSWRRYGLWLSRYQHPRETFGDYLNYFDGAAANISSNNKLVTGDGTPMDFWDFTGWKNIKQNHRLNHPKILTPHLMHHMNPKVKLIIIVRDPTSRLYSDYMFLKLGQTRTSKGFHDAVHFSITYLKYCMKRRTLESCLYDRKHIAMYKARIHVGFYAVYLKEWLKLFPKEQILVLKTEDYAENIKGTLKQIFKFLQLEKLPEIDLDRIVQKEKAYKTTLKKKQGPMHKQTKDLLNKFYKPYNEDLALLLNDSRFMWDT
ncbi:CHST15 [Mytilus edulis]|uniref:CHST15 n=1 Tax=Mytilus edulis TaxID=6550 RepID=A0A8S3QLR9_MYTED|nr:CHST15 [Mytilus edulis]